MDSGATAHMTAHPGNLTSATPVHTPTRITVGNGSSLPITHVGHMSFPSTSTPVHMSNVLVSPDLVTNLVSVRRLARENPITVEFDDIGFSVKDARTWMVLHRCDSPDELYRCIPPAAPPPPVVPPPSLLVSIFGTPASAIPTPPLCVRFFRVFLSHVIRLTTTLVRLAVLASTFVSPLASLQTFPPFRFSYCIVMFGRPRLLATRVIYTIW